MEKQIDWNIVQDYITEMKFDWTIESIKKEWIKFQNKEYVSFTCRLVINNSILTQL